MRISRIRWLVTVIAILLAACSSPATETAEPDNATPPGGKRPTPLPAPAIGQGFSKMAGPIVQHPTWYDNQPVTLVGYFRGLDLLDETVQEPPEDRINDWVLTDDSGTIWVANKNKLPFSSTSHEVWRILRVRGSVQLDDNGKAYINPYEVTWEGLRENFDVLPATCTVAIHRFGGPEKLNHHVYWYNPPGTIAVNDATANWQGSAKLKSGKNYDLSVAFDKADLFNLPGTTGEKCSDCIITYLAAVNPKTERPHFAIIYGDNLPPKVQAFVDLALELSTTAEAVE